jgi:hypothetical protein
MVKKSDVPFYNPEDVLFTDTFPLETFLLRHRLGGSHQTCILDILIKGYEVLNNMDDPGDDRDITESIATSAVIMETNPSLQEENAVELVRKWFTQKEFEGLGDKGNKEDDKSPCLHEACEILQIIEAQYMEHGKRTAVFTMPSPTIHLTRSKDNSYSDTIRNEIYLTMGYHTKEDMDTFVHLFQKWIDGERHTAETFEESMRHNDIFDRFLLTDSRATIPHEYEHYRRATDGRKNNHRYKSSHCDTTEKILPNDSIAITRDFNQCANDVYHHFIIKTSFLLDIVRVYKNKTI